VPDILAKQPKAKSSGAEICAEGPFLKWQNHGSRSAGTERRFIYQFPNFSELSIEIFFYQENENN